MFVLIGAYFVGNVEPGAIAHRHRSELEDQQRVNRTMCDEIRKRLRRRGKSKGPFGKKQSEKLGEKSRTKGNY